jgi:hypothetical protein
VCSGASPSPSPAALSTSLTQRSTLLRLRLPMGMVQRQAAGMRRNVKVHFCSGDGGVGDK